MLFISLGSAPFLNRDTHQSHLYFFLVAAGAKKSKNYISGGSDTSETTSEDTPTGTPTRLQLKNLSDSASSSPCLTPRNDIEFHSHSHKILPSPVKNQNQVLFKSSCCSHAAPELL